jgi:hypothetical protein
VDDASILAAEQCQIETWFERRSDSDRTFHVGPACRIGAIEAAVNADWLHLPGATAQTVRGVQAKWAAPLDERWSHGLLLARSWPDGSTQPAVTTLLWPLTLQQGRWLFHLNLGRDLRQHAPDTSRAGIAAEHALQGGFALLAETFRDSGENRWRAGVRWMQSDALNFDISRLRTRGNTGADNWTLGATWVWDR